MEVKALMMAHGIAAVRGGSYSNTELSAHQRAALSHEIRHARGECLACGSDGHFAAACPASRAAPEVPGPHAMRMTIADHEVRLDIAQGGRVTGMIRGDGEPIVIRCSNDGSIVRRVADAVNVPHADASEALALAVAKQHPTDDERPIQAAVRQEWRCGLCAADLEPTWADDPRMRRSSAVCLRCADPPSNVTHTTALATLSATSLRFGKHRGQTLSRVSTQYLQWLVCGGPAGKRNCAWLESSDPAALRACQSMLAYRLLGFAPEPAG
jgi:hypothetical protein